MANDGKVELAPKGPLIVKGASALQGADGAALEAKQVLALCRCGGSKNRPFCDGTHAKIGFDDARGDDRVPDQRDSYDRADRRLVIHDNRGLCAHAGICSDNLPEVFRAGVEPWIDADGAEAEAIRGIIERCPSGALSYSVEDLEWQRPEGPLKVSVSRNGPYVLEGTSELDAVPPLEGQSDTRRTLCRCGHSKNKPFCDGSHWHQNFRDELDELQQGEPTPREDAAAPSREEPHNSFIHQLAEHGLDKLGGHGPMAAMGVPRYELPSWDDLQFVTAQLHKPPQLDDADVGTELVVGPKAGRPLTLAIPIIVSDMSFGALSLEAKVAMAKGAELAGTGICSGEGGMLPEEQQANSRYFYELASARFGYAEELLSRVQAFHFKGGQGAKTGTGGHLPGKKVTEKIAAVRGLEPGQDAISPARFPDLLSVDDFRRVADAVRELSGGVPIGFKLSAQHIEKDIDAALAVGVDYIILDGRGGGTGAAPLLFRDNISVPTLPALARARRHLDAAGRQDVTLFITGGLRTPADFAKALALGADGVAIANSAMQAIGCVGARLCNTDTCPAGIATQDPALRALIDVDVAAARFGRFLHASVHLMATLARACGHTHLGQLSVEDLTTWKRDVAYLTGVGYGGVVPL